jgi:hypothetical protein
VSGALELGVALVDDFRAKAGERRVRVLDNHQFVVVVEEERVAGLGRVVDHGRLGLDLADLDLRVTGRRARIARVVLRRRREHLDYVVERTEAGHQVADLFPAPRNGRIVERFGRKRRQSCEGVYDGGEHDDRKERRECERDWPGSRTAERDAHSMSLSHFRRPFNRTGQVARA